MGKTCRPVARSTAIESALSMSTLESFHIGQISGITAPVREPVAPQYDGFCRATAYDSS